MMTICLRYSCDRPEAEDMLQEAFIKIFSHLSQYKFEGSFEGWMKRIVVNCALKMIQKKRIRFSEINNHDLTSTQTDSYALSNLIEDELLKLISNIPDGYRIVFNLYVMEGYSHDEIAELLGIQATSSRSQLIKARKLLQKQIIINTQNDKTNFKEKNKNLLPENGISIENAHSSDKVDYSTRKNNKPLLNKSTKEKNINTKDDREKNNESVTKLVERNLPKNTAD